MVTYNSSMDYQSHRNPFALIICLPGEPTGTQGQWDSFGLFQFLGIFVKFGYYVVGAHTFPLGGAICH